MTSRPIPQPPDTSRRTESLDPSDWTGLRQLGHRMVDEMLEYLRTVGDRPLYTPMPSAVKDRFGDGAPVEPRGPFGAYDDFRELVLPYPHGNIHPRFWGWVVGTGTPFGAVAEMLTATVNSNAGFGDQGLVHVELQVIAWLRELLGFPADFSGTLVSGCSVANLTALTMARDARGGTGVPERGVGRGSHERAVYGSAETHSSNIRALQVIGLGRAAFRSIPVDGDYRIRLDRLREEIRGDVRLGVTPVAVIGNAGTVNTGAFDDLEGLAEVAAEFGAWVHIDGAFGALASLAPSLRHLTRGMDLADSVAFDLHKWLHVPYDAGAILVRDAAVHPESFAMGGAYLSAFESGVATGPENFMQRGLQMSRNGRALKVWLTLKEHGAAKFGRLIEQNVRQAHYLADLVDAEPVLQRMAEVPLNIVCLRYAPPGHSESDLDALNRRLLMDLHASGIAAPSHTMLDGRFAIRVAIANHRSRFEDFDTLVESIVAIGDRVAAGEPTAIDGVAR